MERVEIKREFKQNIREPKIEKSGLKFDFEKKP